MTAFLLEVAIRAALIALGTAAVLRLLRIQTAAIRHAAWTAVVITMLCLPVWQAGGIRVAVPVLAPAPAAQNVTAGGNRAGIEGAAQVPAAPIEARVLETPTPESATVSRASVESPFTWQAVLSSLYFAGAIVLLLRLLLGTVEANRLRRGSVMRNGRLTTSRSATPITVGWFTPVLILPDGWDLWSPAKLAAVLTHEREHARRHDPLVQWFALFNRAVFWFHPLAWWLERRLSTLAEEACDAAVLAAGHSPQDYSEYLLEMARSVTTDGKRLHIVGMAMPGTGLTGRVQQIFRGLPNVRISRTRVACTIVFCAMSSAMFASGTLAERAVVPQPSAPATSVHQAIADPPPVAPIRPAETRPRASTRQASVQAPPSAPAMQIKFEVVSIKPCLPDAPGSGRGGSGSMRFSISPGYAHWGCASLADLIDIAWSGPFPDNSLLNTPRLPPNWRPDLPKRIRGGPSWVEQEKFEIEVRLSGDSSTLTGSAHHDLVARTMRPALQAMLEDRFQLKLRKVTEQVPMYALTVAKGGLKIPKCWERDPNVTPAQTTPPAGFEGTPACEHKVGATQVRAGANPTPAIDVNLPSVSGGLSHGNRVWDFKNFNLTDLAENLSKTMDRHVLDKSGVEGRFSFKLEYAPDDNTPGDTQSALRSAGAFAGLRAQNGLPPQPEKEPVTPDGPTIFRALEAMGLKLEPTKGPAEHLQIDSVQRPRPDGPADAARAAMASKPASDPGR